MSLTLEQRTNTSGFPKAGELIEITGAGALEASDRMLMNALYQHAHEVGGMATAGTRWALPMSALRSSTHESNDRLRESLSRLLSVKVNVTYLDEKGKARILQTHLFDHFDTPRSDGGPNGNFLEFAVPDRLRAIIARSGRWGRIKAEVVCAMTSKYAIALYELVQLRSALNRCTEQFPIQRFRDLLGVPEGKLTRGPDFMRFCVDPAVLEVNGLSDVGVQIDFVRAHARAPITAVTIGWWKKEGEEFREAHRERQRSKLGRMARLKGTVENTTFIGDG